MSLWRNSFELLLHAPVEKGLLERQSLRCVVCIYRLETSTQIPEPSMSSSIAYDKTENTQPNPITLGHLGRWDSTPAFCSLLVSVYGHYSNWPWIVVRQCHKRRHQSFLAM
jgi:hypothetical protein